MPPNQKILIVTTDEVTMSVVRMFLSRWGTSIVESSTVSDCLRLAKEHSPVLILTDVCTNCPRAMCLMRELRRRPETKETPIIALVSSTEESSHAILQGANASLYKPVRKTPLKKVVEKILGKK